ncbi:MAG: metallophosphoesterase [Microthrixaceae bacterium]
MELTTVADDEVVVFDGSSLVRYDALSPRHHYRLGGIEVDTLARPGERYATIATVNDIHLGETVCGLIAGTEVGPVFRSEDGEEPYPELMSRGAVAAMQALEPDLVVAKGDLTGNGTIEEYRRFLDLYRSPFGDRLLHVRGNHDSYHGGDFAAFPTVVRRVPGATVALVDTARTHLATGRLSPDQIDWIDSVGADSDEPVLVFGHHHLWTAADGEPREDYFGVRPGDSVALMEVMARRPRILGYFAGHTHRNRVLRPIEAGGAVVVEVASVKDFPGVIAEYAVFENGVNQVVRRIGGSEQLRWTERTRGMFHGAYECYAMGAIGDRCFTMFHDGKGHRLPTGRAR